MHQEREFRWGNIALFFLVLGGILYLLILNMCEGMDQAGYERCVEYESRYKQTLEEKEKVEAECRREHLQD